MAAVRSNPRIFSYSFTDLLLNKSLYPFICLMYPTIFEIGVRREVAFLLGYRMPAEVSGE